MAKRKKVSKKKKLEILDSKISALENRLSDMKKHRKKIEDGSI